MKMISINLKTVLDKYESEVRPAVARLAPDGNGLVLCVLSVHVIVVAAKEEASCKARQAKEEVERKAREEAERQAKEAAKQCANDEAGRYAKDVDRFGLHLRCCSCSKKNNFNEGNTHAQAYRAEKAIERTT
jgi:Ni/Co efflux regulator RcnB